MDAFKKLKNLKVKGWKKDTDNGLGVTYVKPAKIGINYLTENSNKVKLSYHYNGSSNEAFGGADKWPVIMAEVSFQTGEEVIAQKFAEDLMKFINDWKSI